MSKEIIEILVEGGKAAAGAELGGKLGPLKIDIADTIKKINEKTSDFKGMKVPVKIIIQTETKNVEIEVGTPPASELLKKELNIKKGSPKPNKIKVANAAIEQIIKVAKMKQDSMFVNDLKAAVKNIIGSCNAAGILVEGKLPTELIKEIDQGAHDDIISKGLTEVNPEKIKLLKEQFREVELKQQAELEKLKEEQAAKAEAATKEAGVKEEAKTEEEKTEKKK